MSSEVLAVWRAQLEAFLQPFLLALVVGVIVACFGTKVVPRFFIGSVLLGSLLGGGAVLMEWSPVWHVGLTILGVLTAPKTVAMLTGTDLFQALDIIRQSQRPPE